MGIYLKDMKMPKSCSECPLGRRDEMDIVCHIAHERFPVAVINIQEYRLKVCPLVELPSHGKLIDANEFLHRAIGTKCFDEDYARMLQQLVGESVAIIPAEEE